ncbi:hypothetical protein OH77DRAFT_507938 [Trametes cingulata]|nr:hypothetical protein OH77DRAFT_507938 [Trametes cingulata]
MSQTTVPSLLTQIGAMNPSAILPIVMVLGSDVLRRAQSIPGMSPLSIGWPEFLFTLLAHNRSTLPVDSPSTVINAKSGYARTNRSPVLEHLLRSHSSEPAKGSLTVTFLYTSQRPGTAANDAVSYAVIAATAIQLVGAGILPILGAASERVFTITAAGTLLSTAAGAILRRQHQKALHSARDVRPERREVACITSGNGSADAVVVVSEGGGLRIEDLAAGRATSLGPGATICIGVLLVLWTILLLALTTLDRSDAWSVLALSGVGTAYTAFAARKWRSCAALGFRLSEERKKVVRADKVMEVLMKAEELETGVGSALLPIFFPGQLRPEEELWWAERKQAIRASKGLM